MAVKKYSIAFGLSMGLAVIAGAYAQPAEKPADTVKIANTPTDAPLPADVMNRYVEVTGGKAAYEKVRTRSMTSAVAIEPMGIKGDMTMLSVAPNKVLYTVTIPGATVTSGSDGTTFWEMNSATGPRLIEGAERVIRDREATVNNEMHWDKMYTRATLDGADTIDGKSAWKVVLVGLDNATSYRWFNKDTGLLVKEAYTLKVAGQDQTVEAFPTEYKKVGDLLVAHKITVKVGKTTQTVTISKIEYNTDIPQSKFQVSSEVSKLVDAAKANEKK